MNFPFAYPSPFIAADVFSLGTVCSTVDGTNFSFTNFNVGIAFATRLIVVFVSSGAAAAIVPSSVTIGGVAAKVLETNASTVGNSLWSATVPTGTTATVDVVFTLTQSQCCVTLYAADTDLNIPHRSALATGVSNPELVLDVPVGVGGKALLGWVRSSGGSGTTEVATWTGSDPIVEDYQAAIEAAIRVGSSHVLSTQLSDTNDFSVTVSAGTFFGIGVCLALLNGTSYFTPALTANPSDATGLTTYTFSTQAIGTADANRQLVLCFVWGSATNPTISTITVDGSSTGLVIEQNPGTNTGIARIPWPTGTTATIVITMSAVCTAMVMGIYNTRPRTLQFPVDSLSANGSGTSVAVQDIAVRQGGFLIGCALVNALETASAVYTGIDTLTKDGQVQVLTFTTAFFSASTTESIATNDAGVSSSGSNVKRISFISFL